MLESTTVTLPLSDFDKLRDSENMFKSIASKIASCYEYIYRTNPIPEDCKTCKRKSPNCDACEVLKANPLFDERLIVDVERLIRITKDYALYGKNVDADIDDLQIQTKTADKKAKKESHQL